MTSRSMTSAGASSTPTSVCGCNVLAPYTANVAGRYIGHYQDYQEFSPNSNVLGDFWLFDANFRYSFG